MVKISSKIIKLEEKDSYIIEQFKDTNKLENSFFYDVYISVFKSMGKIINDNPDDNNDRIHNIISIIGDRGKGKTSALHTIKYILENKDIIKNNKDIDDSLKEKNFKFTDPIDPSLIAYNDSIVQIIISGLLKDIKENVEKNCNFIEDPKNTIREFNKQLTKIFAILRTINCKNICEDYEEEGAAEALLNIASAFELKKEIESLIDKYLKIVKCNYLVITIDDMDMNVKHSYKMIEEIRKYLQVKNTIILMGLKIEQLTDAVKIKFNKDFRFLKDIENENLLKEKIINASEKYIEKLLPASKRVYLPEIAIEDPVLYNEKSDEKSDKKSDKKSNVVDSFFNIICKKTGIILIKPEYGVHPLFPRSIREYKNFYFFMKEMEDLNCENNEENILTRIKQLKKFKEYMLNNYANSHFSSENRKFLIEISDNLPEWATNKYVIQYLYNNVLTDKEIESIINNKKEGTKIGKKLEIFLSIADIINSANNITIGDVLFFIEILEQVSTDLNRLKLMSMIKLLYSIKLNILFYYYKYYKYYNNKTNEYTLYLNKFEELTHGNFRGHLIEYEIRGIQNTDTGVSRVKFPIKLDEKIEYLHLHAVSFIDLHNKIKEYITEDKEDKKNIFYDDVISFFYLNAFLRYGKEDSNSYFLEKNCIFYKEFKHQTKNATFDLFGFLVYMMDEKYLFGRLYDDFEKDKIKYKNKLPEIFELIKNFEEIMFTTLNIEVLIKISNEIEGYNYKEKSNNLYYEEYLYEFLKIFKSVIKYNCICSKESKFLTYMLKNFKYSIGYFMLNQYFLQTLSSSAARSDLIKKLEDIGKDIDKELKTTEKYIERINNGDIKKRSYNVTILKKSLSEIKIDNKKINEVIEKIENVKEGLRQYVKTKNKSQDQTQKEKEILMNLEKHYKEAKKEIEKIVAEIRNQEKQIDLIEKIGIKEFLNGYIENEIKICEKIPSNRIKEKIERIKADLKVMSENYKNNFNDEEIKFIKKTITLLHKNIQTTDSTIVKKFLEDLRNILKKS